MKKVLAIMLVLTVAFGVIGCSNSKEITMDDIVGKVYVYEKDGCGSDFTIRIKADGTFNYYEGFLSSHIGMGEWSYSDGMLTLFEKTSRFNEAWELEEVIDSYNFSVEKDTLIFVDKDSGNFRYVRVKDGEKFFGSIDYPSMVMFNNILYTGTYYSGDKVGLSAVGKIESCIDHGVPSENNQANDPLVGCEIYTTSSAPDFIFVLNNGIYSSYKSAEGAGTDNQQTQNNDTPSNTKYKLTVIDDWGYLVNPLNEYYEAGEEVDVTLAFLSGPSVGIQLNGEYIGENSAAKYDGVYPIITFTMPAGDSVLYTTQNGHISKQK